MENSTRIWMDPDRYRLRVNSQPARLCSHTTDSKHLWHLLQPSVVEPFSYSNNMITFIYNKQFPKTKYSTIKIWKVNIFFWSEREGGRKQASSCWFTLQNACDSQRLGVAEARTQPGFTRGWQRPADGRRRCVLWAHSSSCGTGTQTSTQCHAYAKWKLDPLNHNTSL